MAEGISWDNTLDYLYVSAEADYWSIWRTTNYDVRSTFSGLSDGNYVLRASFTDSYGTAATATSNTSGTTATIVSGGSGYTSAPTVIVTG